MYCIMIAEVHHWIVELYCMDEIDLLLSFFTDKKVASEGQVPKPQPTLIFTTLAL